ncbi:hypothetical protein PV327_004064 [Microctonus hyperodae]|uniref:Uncharacterized protein n=1 Tax=Microctonus hyperodae TaxID=165561 RepID=A0AA39KM53_MICHY|nr:hypothetical protein PV327_004064 [Microctonus hyperodae]
MNREKSSGPSTEPCGTPPLTAAQLEVDAVLLSTTQCDRPVSRNKLQKLLKELEKNENKDHATNDIDLKLKTPIKTRKRKRSSYKTDPKDASLVGGDGYSTPIECSLHELNAELQFSGISMDESTDINKTSPPPSGLTDALNDMGENWPNSSARNNTSRDVTDLSTDISVDPKSAEVPNFNNDDNHKMNCKDDELLNDEAVTNQLNMNDHHVDSMDTKCDNDIQQQDVDQNNFNMSICDADDEYEGNITEQTDVDHNENSSKDPNYVPNMNTSVETSENSQTELKDVTNEQCNVDDESTDISAAQPSVDIRKLKVLQSNKSGIKTTKNDFCIYCKKLVTQFGRHLLTKDHRNEEDVKLFMKYPRKSTIRKQLISKIQRKGNFLHNTNPDYNTGILITARRQQSNSKNNSQDYIVCTHCQGSFSKRTIRLHYEKCNTNHRKGVREISAMGRRMSAYVHASANYTLKKVIIPGMHDDAVTRAIKYDELIILAGNQFCESYTRDQHVELIRGHLRLLGRLKLAMIAKNPAIEELNEMFDTKNYQIFKDAIRSVAQYDVKKRVYGAPANATMLGTLVKKLGKIWNAQCTLKEDWETQKKYQNFLSVFDYDFPTTINKKVIEEQTNRKRENTVILPMKEDIKKLYDHLKQICNEAVEKLEENFNYTTWKNLSEACLILLQMFNRRRSGEIERLLITDYQKQESIDENMSHEYLSKLSKKSRALAKKFVRITIRGKLNRTVPVLLDGMLAKYVNTILEHRCNAGVKPSNVYVFGIPTISKMTKKYLRACPLMRKFSEQCGAKKIRDVTDVSQLLLGAMGADDEDDANESENSDEDDQPENRNYDEIARERSTMTSINETNTSDDSGSEYNSDESNPKPRKRLIDPPMRNVVRNKWTDEEKAAVEHCFGNVLTLEKLPSRDECAKAIA